ncbi:MAG TPA: hypothetical protein VMI31_19145 [Fimbriimonadaceae bacterium]|nr:hypothetical protein [Fimbriimonadaceae bacterium]
MELPDFFERAEMGWGPAPGGRFSLSLADQGDRRKVRAELAIDAIGTFWLALRDSDGIFLKTNFRGDPAWCVAQAETVIGEAFEGAMRLASRDAAWRFLPITDKQLGFLLDQGLDATTAESLTRGQATRMISLLLAAR